MASTSQILLQVAVQLRSRSRSPSITAKPPFVRKAAGSTEPLQSVHLTQLPVSTVNSNALLKQAQLVRRDFAFHFAGLLTLKASRACAL